MTGNPELIGAWLDVAVSRLTGREASLRAATAAIEREVIAQAVSQTKTIAGAARAIGMNRTTLILRLRRLREAAGAREAGR